MEWFTKLFGGDGHQRMLTSVVIFFLTTVASLFIGKWWGRWRSSREWARKQFLGRFMVSLNNFSDDYLKIRTIFERSIEVVFTNTTAAEKVMAASRLTTAENPILPIASEDRWFLLNFVLNAVAEEFTQGLVAYDAGQPMKPVTYLIWMTCEQVGPDRVRKVRAMMIRKDTLLDLPKQQPKFEQPWHSDRMVTLKSAADQYASDPSHFLSLEVYVPC